MSLFGVGKPARSQNVPSGARPLFIHIDPGTVGASEERAWWKAHVMARDLVARRVIDPGAIAPSTLKISVLCEHGRHCQVRLFTRVGESTLHSAVKVSNADLFLGLAAPVATAVALQEPGIETTLWEVVGSVERPSAHELMEAIASHSDSFPDRTVVGATFAPNGFDFSLPGTSPQTPVS